MRDVCRKYGKTRPINLDDLAATLPSITSTRRLIFRLTISPPNELLDAAASLPNLTSLEFEETRLDGILPSLQTFTRLRRLTMTVVPQVDKTPYPIHIDIPSERSNINSLLRTTAKNLDYLEIAGDLLDLHVLESLRWPNLETLIISGHRPDGLMVPVSVFVAEMPKLVNLSLAFTALVDCEVPPFIFCPQSADIASLSSVVPNLRSLTLSNVFPEDRIFGQLPPSLTKLRVLALKDAFPRNELLPLGEQLRSRLYPYSPLSPRRVLNLADRIKHLCGISELSLTVTETLGPELITAIAEACPDLRLLEIEVEESTKIEPYCPVPLVSLSSPCNRALRLTILPFLQGAIYRTSQAILPLASIAYDLGLHGTLSSWESWYI